MITRLIAGAFFLSLALMANSVQAQEAQGAPKEWTFLLFLNGNNNLDTYGAYNINQMEQVGSTDQLNMVVQWASLRAGDTKRLYVTKDSDVLKVNSQVVQAMGKVDMGDYHQLIDFVKWGVENYPAKHYMIAVWNHGNGWHLMDALGRQIQPLDISYDDNTGNVIRTEELGIAMAAAARIIGHKVDIYGSDACLMAMAEVAIEMKDSVDYFVGSQETEPGYGWPYNTWMARWAADTSATPAKVSTYLTEEYMKAYSGGIYGNQDVTFSAWDMSKLPAFIDAMKNLNASLANLSASDLVQTKAAVNNTQEFYSADYKDIYDFAANLEKGKVGIEASILSSVKQSVSAMMVSEGASSGYPGAHGVSVWMPTSSFYMDSYKARYAAMEFNKATGWLDFLVAMNK